MFWEKEATNQPIYIKETKKKETYMDPIRYYLKDNTMNKLLH